IAKRYGISVATLKRLNGLKSDRIIAGQSLVVSGRAAPSKAKKAPAKKTQSAKPPAKKPGAAKPAAGAKKPVVR
ncbi:MAG: LysM peptidoglycan-binding domain-containing protein, partial [Gemmatimonadaceae bacterium]